jgi:hypothetical protein
MCVCVCVCKWTIELSLFYLTYIQDYVLRMINNRRSLDYIANEMELFLGKDGATEFVKWLFNCLINVSSTILDNNNSDNNGYSKEKRCHMFEKKNWKKYFCENRNSGYIWRRNTSMLSLDSDPRRQVLDEIELREYFVELNKQHPDKYPRYESVAEFSRVKIEDLLSNVRWLIERTESDFLDLIKEREEYFEKVNSRFKIRKNYKRSDSKYHDYWRREDRYRSSHYRSTDRAKDEGYSSRSSSKKRKREQYERSDDMNQNAESGLQFTNYDKEEEQRMVDDDSTS